MPETAHPNIANSNLTSPRGIPGFGSNYLELRGQEFFVLRIELPIVVFRICRDDDWFPTELRQMTREEPNACCRRKTARNKVSADDGYAFHDVSYRDIAELTSSNSFACSVSQFQKSRAAFSAAVFLVASS